MWGTGGFLGGPEDAVASFGPCRGAPVGSKWVFEFRTSRAGYVVYWGKL